MNTESDSVRRTIGADVDGIEAMLRNMANSLAELREGESLEELIGRAPAIIEKHVRAIERNLATFDAYDVLDFLRHREVPLMLDGYRESLEDQRPAAIDLVAVILLARGSRTATAQRMDGSRPSELIESLHSRASQLLTIGQFALLEDGRKQHYGPLTMLAEQEGVRNELVTGSV